MKFDNLKENTTVQSAKVKEYLSYIDKIRKECAPFLKDEQHLIYRGILSANELILEKTVRPDRKPKDTTPYMSNIFDDIFQDLFGIKLRSEALFATRNYSDASEYGTVYCIFIKGDYDMFVSNKISDLYSDVAGRGMGFLTGMDKEDFINLGKNKEEKEIIETLYNTHEYRHVQTVLKELTEVHREFRDVAMKMHDFIIQHIKDFIKDSYDYDDGSEKRKELMIAVHDTQRKYYCVNMFTLRKNMPVDDIGRLNGSPAKLLDYIEKQLTEGIWAKL